MTSSPAEGPHLPDDAGLFSPEEAALIASASAAATAETEADLAALGIRVREMARLVAEGYERERLLRRAVTVSKSQTALDEHADALLAAMKQLAGLLAASAEREVILRQSGLPRGEPAPTNVLAGP